MRHSLRLLPAVQGAPYRAEQLVEDGTLDELAKVMPLDSAFVDSQLAAECRLKGTEPKQD